MPTLGGFWAELGNSLGEFWSVDGGIWSESIFSVQYWLALPMQGKKAFCCFIQLGAAL
jgi:hypothetical protein